MSTCEKQPDAPPPYTAEDCDRPTAVSVQVSTMTGPHVYEIDAAAGTFSSLQIKQNDGALYYVTHYDEVNTPDIVLFAGYDSKGPRLAQTRFIPSSKDFKFYIGGLKTPTGDDWDLVRYAQGRPLSHASYRFQTSSTDSNGRTLHQKYNWKKTSDSKLGASKLSRRDYRLVDESNDEVVATFAEKYSLKTKGTMTFRKDLDAFSEMAALMVLLSLLEKSRRRMVAISKGAFPM
jgi:hypothetical protein